MIGKIILIVILAIFARFLLKVIYSMEFHVSVINHSPGPCRLVPQIEHGSEDMHTLKNGLTFITSGLHFSAFPIKDEAERLKRKGKIFLFDFQTPEENPRKLKLSEGFDEANFKPHGISVWENSNTGQITLFIINHHPDGERIETFLYILKSDELQHKRSYSSPTMTLMNDVVATGEDSFYFSNMFHYSNFFLRHVEVFNKWGNIMYYDGSEYKVAASGIGLPNGMAMSEDAKYIYAIHGGSRELGIYSRRQDGILVAEEVYQLHTGLDNPTVDLETGDVWIGAQSVTYRTYQYLMDPHQEAPSKVLKLEVRNGKVNDVTEVYSNDGSELSGATVASRYKKHLLVGSIHSGLLYCELRSLPPY